MTQAATTTKLTLEQLGAMCREKAPDRLPLFEEISQDLMNPLNDRIACKEKLEAFVRCPVRFRVAGNEELYSWEGKQGTYELGLMRAPQETAQAAPESPLALEKPQEAQAEPPATREAKGEPQADPAPSEEREQPQAYQEAEPTPSPGTFTALAALLGEATLLMTVARSGEGGDEPVLTVNVVPKSEGEMPFAPVSLEGKASELDKHFVQAIQAKAEGQRCIREATLELKAADEALAQAKKQEAEAKKKEAEAKKKSALKKENAQTEETKAQKQQDALF
jgi:PRTRC genetic system protein E